MKLFEVQYILLRPFLLPLHNQVHHELKSIIKGYGSLKPKLLDIGGRKSHYTIGLHADVTITDLPRESSVQQQLHLGINDEIIRKTLERRSNIEQIIFDNMEETSLPDQTFDIAVAVEVLEHVEKDADFIHNVYRVLKPGGVFFMTTPNGDYITVVTNPDHKRHYRHRELVHKLSRCFDEVEVYYAVSGGRFHKWGLKSWSITHPLSTTISAISNVVNRWESSRPSVKKQAYGTHHLMAVAKKPLE